MKIVALYDIHGNLPALDAVLQEVEQEHPDLILVGGDTLPGPMPRAALERLLALGDKVQYIRGNCEREVVAAFDGLPPPSSHYRKLAYFSCLPIHARFGKPEISIRTAGDSNW